MLTVAEAMESLLATVEPSGVVRTHLNESLGLTLAEDVRSTADSPPFDKSLMDGYALRSVDWTNGISRFRVVDVVTAGRLSTREVASGEAVQIMTGAPIPAGADVVVKLEDTHPDDDHVVVDVNT